MDWLIDRLIELENIGWYYRQWLEAGDLICAAVESWPDFAPPPGPNVAAFPARQRGWRQFLGCWIRGKLETDIDRMIDVAAGLSMVLHGCALAEVVTRIAGEK